MKYNQGVFKPKNAAKYRGDISNIVYRSSWEAAVMAWLDSNSEVTAWSSEEFVVPYVCPVDNRVHRYYIDFWIQTTKGTYLVEVKPQKECLPPKTGKGRRKATVLNETATYARNMAKWESADQYAKQMGYKFFVWDEVTLKSLGVVL